MILQREESVKIKRKPKKEQIIPPSRGAAKQAAKETKKGSRAGGRVLVEVEVAKRQGASR
jgi:hypothetical protein